MQAPEFSWSYAKSDPKDRRLEGVVRSSFDAAHVQETPFKAAAVQFDRDAFVKSAMPLKAAFPNANVMYFVSRGSSDLPVPIVPPPTTAVGK